jgi:hypothetical protein
MSTIFLQFEVFIMLSQTTTSRRMATLTLLIFWSATEIEFDQVLGCWAWNSHSIAVHGSYPFRPAHVSKLGERAWHLAPLEKLQDNWGSSFAPHQRSSTSSSIIWKMCWGSQQKTKKIPINLFPWSIYAVERQWSSGGVHTFEDQKWDYVSAQTLSMKTDEADLKVV